MQLWAIARMQLGLSSAEFWSLTPQEFHALQAEWLNQRRFQDEQDARRDHLLYAMYALVHDFAGAKPKAKVRDFDTFLRYSPRESQVIELDAKGAQQLFRGWAMAMGGSVN